MPYHVYVDGSYSSNYHITARWAWVIYWSNAEQEEELQEDDTAQLIGYDSGLTKNTGSNNVDGELRACIEACKFCLDNNYDDIVIIYDYEGIRSWALNLWKCNKEISIKYKAEIQELMPKFHKFRFAKVASKSNSKQKFVDGLAKSASTKNSPSTLRHKGEVKKTQP